MHLNFIVVPFTLFRRNSSRCFSSLALAISWAMEALQFWDTLEILLIFMVRFFFALPLSFAGRSPAWRRLVWPEEAGKEIDLDIKAGWRSFAAFISSGAMQNFTEKMVISKLGIKSKKLTFWNLLASSRFWKENTRHKGEAVPFLNHIGTLPWNLLIRLFPQKSTQRTFKSRPEHKRRYKFVRWVMEVGSRTKGSSNSPATPRTGLTSTAHTSPRPSLQNNRAAGKRQDSLNAHLDIVISTRLEH